MQMRSRARAATTLIVLVAVTLLTGTPLLVEAAQILPTPNTGTITVDTADAYNSLNPFENLGDIDITNSGMLTNTAEGSLRNGTSYSSAGTITNAGTLNNYGSLSSHATSTLINAGLLTNAGTLSTLDGGMTNSEGATLINTGTLTTTWGSIRNAGTVTNTGTLWVSDGTLNNGATGVLNNSGVLKITCCFGVLNDGVLNNSATFTVSGALFFTNSGTLTNTGTFNNDFMSQLVNTGTLINTGTLNNSFASLTNTSLLINTGELTNIGSNARISNESGATLINTGSITNVRTFTNRGTVSGTGMYIQQAGGPSLISQTINNGTLTQSGGVSIQGGNLSGLGTINATVTMASGALLAPGDGSTLGKLTINGNLYSSGDLAFRISGLSAGQFDVLAIHGMAFLNGGALNVNFLGFTPVAGNSWDLFFAHHISGWDTLNINVDGLGPDLYYKFMYANGVQTLTIHPVPEPDSFLLLLIALGALASWRRLQYA